MSVTARLGRRAFVQLALAGGAWLAARPRPALAQGAPPYRVGVGKSSDAYTATRRAVEASGEWPAERMAGRTVVVKPNLVSPKPSSSGATTDPEVVRALVDLSLLAGAARVLIAESQAPPGNFSACGYDFFNSYDPQARVSLVNLYDAPTTLAPVTGGLAYLYLSLPSLVLDPSIVFVSAAKLKTHGLASATLSVKNLYGLPPPRKYYTPTQRLPLPRNALHTRGMDQSALDLALVRPIDFAVVDGVWGMEGDGPSNGSPVRMDLVLAGRNAVAVDRVGLDLMGIRQDQVPHLTYATFRKLGPIDTSSVQVGGDAVAPRAFQAAPVPPMVWVPIASPRAFSPASGLQTSIGYRLDGQATTRVDITQTSELSPSVTPIRALQGWMSRPPGVHTIAWDGRDDAGQLVAAGAYRAQVQAVSPENGRGSYAMGWVIVAT